MELRAGILSIAGIFNVFDIFKQNMHYYRDSTYSTNQIQICDITVVVARLQDTLMKHRKYVAQQVELRAGILSIAGKFNVFDVFVLYSILLRWNLC